MCVSVCVDIYSGPLGNDHRKICEPQSSEMVHIPLMGLGGQESDNHMYRLDYYFSTIQESWIPDGHDVKGGAKHNGVAPGHQTIGI